MKYIVVLLTLISFSFAIEIKECNSYKEAINLGKKEKKDVLMFVYSDYCPWCYKMEHQTLKDKKAIKFINEKYIFVKMNKDKDKYPSRFYPRFIPTTYQIDPNTKEEKYALYGYKNTEQLISELTDDLDDE